MGRPAFPALVVTLLVLAACGGDDAATPTPALTASADPPETQQPTPASPAPSPSPSPSPDLEAVRLRLVEVAPIEGAIAMGVREGDDAIYVATKQGTVVAVRQGEVSAPIIDLGGEISDGFEQGLLGLAISPDGRFVYVNFTDGGGDTHVVEFAFDGDAVDAGSRREVLRVEQPYRNHNGGHVVFGPDGYLYVGLGDGGSGGDPHGHGQDLGTMLGSILRIDPRPSGNRPYAVPHDNPFTDRDGARPEIWDYGLRNPWRFSFDRETSDLWIADVGQRAREEVNFESADSGGGQNYGWNAMEGTVPFLGGPPRDAVPPIHEYATGERGRAIIGGYVYRGSAIPELRGAYLFTDFYDTRITALVQRQGEIVEERVVSEGVPATMSFGEDLDGELYVLSWDRGLFRIEPR